MSAFRTILFWPLVDRTRDGRAFEPGAARGASSSPWFDPKHYALRRGEALGEGANPLLDYLQGGAWSVAEPAPGFSTAAYVATPPELAAQGLTPLHHWARAAATDRRHRD